jgi:ankyrin repeat protein
VISRHLAAMLIVGFAAASAAADLSLPAAVQSGDTARVDALIAAGEGLDATLPEYYGATALMLAAERDDTPLVARLITAGADLDARDRNGDTALNWAAYHGHMGPARALLEAGADPRLAGHGDALQIALRRGHEELVQVLSVAMEARRTPGPREAPVMIAVYQNDARAVAAALDRGGEPDARDDLGRPLLHLAARLGHVEALTALLAGGADPDAVDEIGFTALMIAAREARPAAVASLLEAGADPTHQATRAGNGLVPMHLAAIGGDPGIVRSLHEVGAPLDVRDEDGVVPMLWALAEGQLDAVVTLIELGADPTLASDDGDSVAALAETHAIQPVLEAIAARSGD